MSGKPGRSGGARPGSGPARKHEELATDGKQEPLSFLLAVMNDNTVDARLRVRAAVAAAQYRHVKRADGGKKDDKDRAAKLASAGKFAPAAPPKLVVNNK